MKTQDKIQLLNCHFILSGIFANNSKSQHRRKQLGTIFKGVVESTARAEELSNEDWLGLAEALAEHDIQEGKSET